MEITIGSYKMRVEILLLIIVLFWVAFGHLLCGCCKVSLFEGFDLKNKIQKNINDDLSLQLARATDTAKIARYMADDAQTEADKLKSVADEAQTKAYRLKDSADEAQVEVTKIKLKIDSKNK